MTINITPEHKAKGISTKLILLAITIITLFLLVLLYSIFQSPQEKTETETVKQNYTPKTEQTLLDDVENLSGLAVKAPDPVPISLPSPQISPELLALKQREAQFRDMKLQQELQALQSPLIAIQGQSPQAQQNMQPMDFGFERSEIKMPDITDKANPSKEKEEFLTTRSQTNDDWALGYDRTAGADFELKTGSVIQGIMLTSINSDLPGQIIGQVSQNIYDSATGKYLLIPQGTRLFGVYDSRLAYGQNRLLIAWNRLIFPDGSSLSLGSMSGADEAGKSGLNDKVDNHYFRIFGSAILMSLISGATAYAVDSFSGKQSEDNPSMQDELASAVATGLSQSSLALLEQNMTIKPTLEIGSGYRFNLVLVKDLIFEAPYKSYR